MATHPMRLAFEDELGRVLARLYDPDVLRRSSLMQWFDLAEREDATDALRDIIVNGIETLKPQPAVPRGSNAWRFYHILNQRFGEQFTQVEVADDLSLSVRQLRRQEATAQQILADYLWSHYSLGSRAATLDKPPAADVPATDKHRAPDQASELAWLARTAASESLDLGELAGRAVETVRPLLDAAQVTIRNGVMPGTSVIVVQPMAIRQAILHSLISAARQAPGGTVSLASETATGPAHALLIVTATAAAKGVRNIGCDDVAVIEKLVALAGGTLELDQNEGAQVFSARLRLPLARTLPVLVVDDNLETLDLCARYLSETPFRYVGTDDPHRAVSLAEEANPAAIVLDVMLPDIDGWELLGRFREHPAMRATPVIVSTILPQPELALTLGAAEFLRKPLSREALLAALDRHVLQPRRAVR